MDNYNTVEKGSVVRFVKGKKENNVAFTITGKVIICKHPIPLGYATIKSVEDRGNFYLVEAEHTIVDLYPTISYDEFIETIKHNGYEIGFDREFEASSIMCTPTTEHQIFAYNIANATCIVASTCTVPSTVNTTKQIFYNMGIYLPYGDLRDFSRHGLFSSGSNLIVKLDAIKMRDTFHVKALSYVAEYMKNIVLSKLGSVYWPVTERPSFITYEDKPRTNEDFNKIFFERMSLADDKALEIFQGCDFIPELMKYKYKKEGGLDAKLGK